MTRKKLNIIIACVTVGVIGLIALQFYFISQAVSQNEARFEENAKQAVSRLAYGVKKYEHVNRIKRKEGGQELYKQMMAQKNGNKNLVVKDTIIYINGQPVRQQYVSSQGPNGTITSSYTQVGGNNSITNLNMNGWAQDVLTEQGGMSDFFGDAFNLNMLKDLDQRLPSKAVDSLLELELKNNCISTDYDFVVYDAIGAPVFYKNESSKEKVNELIASNYQAPLFPDDLFGSPYSISIIFPNKRSYIIGKMWVVLTLCLLLFVGIIYGFYLTIATIFKQKKLSEIKNDFIGNMTHELKTPISTISLACEALTDTGIQSTVEQRSSFVRMISEENKRLGVLVENVLQSAVIERGELKLKPIPLSIHDIINKAVTNIAIQIENKGGELNKALNAKNDIVIGDSVHLTNVIYNLLDNANKYTPATPEITIITEEVVDGLVIKVTDNGIGISKENQKRIFDSLYRVPTGNVHDVKGFGLGLSYVKAIIDKHKGQISVNSSPGKGSTFIIELPRKNNNHGDIT